VEIGIPSNWNFKKVAPKQKVSGEVQWGRVSQHQVTPSRPTWCLHSSDFCWVL